MPSLRRWFSHLSIDSLSAPNSSVGRGGRAVRTWQRAVCAAASVVALLGAGASLAATPAGAASPWWHLTSGTRPTYIDPGHGIPTVPGAPEVQEITVHLGEVVEPEQGGARLFVTPPSGPPQEIGNFLTEPLAEIIGVPPLSPAALTEALEVPYGAGKVQVTEHHPAAGELTFTIESPFGGAPISVQTVAGLEALPPPSVTILSPGTQGDPGRPDGEIYATAINLGDAAVPGATSPVKITDVLPPGLHAISIAASQPLPESINLSREVPCKLATLSCEMSRELPSYDQIELRIGVEVTGPVTQPNRVSVSGGTAPAAELARPIVVSTQAVPFGVETYSLRNEEPGGASAPRAASHPFQQTTTIALNQLEDMVPVENGTHRPTALPAAPAKDTSFHWPAGLIGNPSPFARCTDAEFTTIPAGFEVVNACPQSSAVGVASVTVTEHIVSTATLLVPLFNLEPLFGQPARLGFYIEQTNTPVYIEPAVRSADGEDYGLNVDATNITQIAGLNAATVTVWGDPGDPRHAASRGWGCLAATRGESGKPPCEPANETHPPAFLSLPTRCESPLASSLFGDSWADPFPSGALPQLASYETPALTACNQVPFDPTMHAEPTSNAATSPTGLAFDLGFEDEGLLNSEGLIESELKRAVVTLPQGFTTNPSVAEGLKACSPAQFHAETLQSQAGEGCPNESKIGDVELESPLIEGQKVTGSLYVATQRQNTYDNLLTIYLVVRDRERGVIVKQALKVTPDPVTGQLTTEVDSVPQLPFSKFNLSFRQGQRSPLITPQACGTYTVSADLYPWARPTEPVHRESSFQINQGPEGQGCPSGGTPPFHPGLEAGTVNNAAGTYSPFYAHITRKDSEQEITHFSIKLPPGLSGKLAGVAKCSNAAIAAAKAREHELGGSEELEHPSCPAGSEVGHTLVGTGVGNVLAYAPGKLYLAGPYHGSNLSIVSITAAKVGPFDLGTVVIRQALKIDPVTAQVSADGATSDPIPHIVDGIPVHLRDIRIYVDRPSFTINPTSCAKTSTAATVLGSGLNFASEADDVPVTVTSPFQAADCASLAFRPNLELKLSGPTKRAGLPKLKAVVTYPKGGSYANIAKTIVTLPPSEFLEQGHIGSSCTRVQFNAGGGNGEQCPAKSILGKAKAITPLLSEPIEGNVYLRSNGGERKLPDLVAALHSEDINIDLVGFISSLHKKGSEVSQIRNTFAAVPDAPVSKFTLELFGGKKGLLVNSTNICKGTHKAISEFTGQNGKRYDTEPAVKAQCGKKGKKSKKGGGKNSKRHAKGK